MYSPVVVAARPLLLYVVLNMLTQVTLWRARWNGFQLERQGRLRYLIYRPEGWTSKKAQANTQFQPIIFLHGLGIGKQSARQTKEYLTRTRIGWLFRAHPATPRSKHIRNAPDPDSPPATHLSGYF